MVSGLFLSGLAVGYLALLFGIAFYGERRSIYPSRERLRPYIYSLALGVYCTTWTFFGAVGTAVRDGWSYLPIYLGPALVFLAATPFLGRLVAIARAHNITSIGDFISSRFGKSPALAALVTVIALTAAVPYLSLQYKAVGTSIDVLTATVGRHEAWFTDPALAVALLMALFAALFGTRQLDATEHHEGVMLAIAFESLVKLLSFVAVGVFALLHLDGAPPLSATRLGDLRDVASPSFAASTLLAAAAIFCLPRQFLVGVVECADPTDLRTARWVFPAYLAVFTVFVVPVVLAGLGLGLGERHQADSFVLSLPMEHGATSLAILVFLGGLSAATAMVIMASIALATMITNDLVMPALWRGRWLGIGPPADVGRLVLRTRRVVDRAAGAAGLRLPPRHQRAGEPRFDRPAGVRRRGEFRARHPRRPVLARRDARGRLRGLVGRLPGVDLRAAAADLRRRRGHRPAAARRRDPRRGNEHAGAGRRVATARGVAA